MLYNGIMSTGESQYLPPGCRGTVCGAIKGVTQTRYWQPDGPIVPRKMGNAIRGKRRRDVPHIPAMQNYIEEETLSILRGRRNNGNEIGENITLNVMLEKRPTNYVLDADIKGFFDHIDHEWAVRFIEARIKDPNITRLVRRMLKSGIMKDYHYEKTEEGSGQGSVCSPIIANIYMHYVLVWWFKECIQPRLKGYGGLAVYADDFVFCFQYREEAERFYEH